MLDIEAMVASIITYAIYRADVVNNSCLRYDPSPFAKVVGNAESTMAMLYKAIIDSGAQSNDFICMIDIVSSILNERFSNTLEGRIVFHIVKMDYIIQTVQLRFDSSKQDGIVNINHITDNNRVIYYPSGVS